MAVTLSVVEGCEYPSYSYFDYAQYDNNAMHPKIKFTNALLKELYLLARKFFIYLYKITKR
jgi:hypothetical protein